MRAYIIATKGKPVLETLIIPGIAGPFKVSAVFPRRKDARLAIKSMVNKGFDIVAVDLLISSASGYRTRAGRKG